MLSPIPLRLHRNYSSQCRFVDSKPLWVIYLGEHNGSAQACSVKALEVFNNRGKSRR
jgi:hypothetical protein